MRALKTHSWVQNSALILSSCVILGNLINLSVLSESFLLAKDQPRQDFLAMTEITTASPRRD